MPRGATSGGRAALDDSTDGENAERCSHPRHCINGSFVACGAFACAEEDEDDEDEAATEALVETPLGSITQR
jgi:hypothetical protein